MILSMSRRSEQLMEMYRAMHARFGHQAWWPGETPLEICVGAILTQNTNWKNVEKAINNLKAARRLTVAALHSTPVEQLAELIRPAGYYNIKAGRLRNFIAGVWEFYAARGTEPDGSTGELDAFFDRPFSTLREALLGVSGIGRETADSILLYAANKCTFVVDAYTYRILLRHQMIAPEDDYEAIKELMESALPRERELWNDYHAQLVAVGKEFCRPTPRCDGCPLQKFPHDVRPCE